MKNIKNNIVGILILFIGATFLPQSAKAGCNSLCQTICGAPANQACQLTYCDGGTHLCTGNWVGS